VCEDIVSVGGLGHIAEFKIVKENPCSGVSWEGIPIFFKKEILAQI
jgi:hypothetical protein